MTDETSRPAFAPKPEPFFKAPLIVVLMAALLLGLYAAYFFAPYPEQVGITYDYALAPERFWAPAGDLDVYPDVWSGLITLASSALLHGDWMHVIVNTLMLLVFGAPVARTLGDTPRGWALWMVIFVGSIVAGSAVYLIVADVNSPFAVGASGGTSGLIAAAGLLDHYGMKQKLWSRSFLMFTAAFAAINAALTLLTFAAPQILGMGIAWEAHAGGYIAGAILMTVLPVKGFRPRES